MTSTRAGAAGPTTGWRRGPRTRTVTLAAAVLVALSATRLVTGAEDLTSSGTVGAAARLAVPILLAGLGGLWAERAGVINIGLEGMMILGTWFGAWGGLQYGPWAGVALGAAGGAAGALLHAAATVRFGVDHIVSGVAVNILAAGAVRLLSALAWSDTAGAGVSASPRLAGDVGRITVPFLAGGQLGPWTTPDLLGLVERSGWPVVGDAAGALRGLTASVSWLTAGSFLLVPATAWLLWQTRFGLRLRACGELPEGARAAGVAVSRLRTIAVLGSGALAGLGGAYLALEGAHAYQEGQTNGRGFIGLGALIFGNWRPGGVAAGAGLFGFADALQLRDPAAVRALLLPTAVVLFLVAGRWARQRRPGPATLAAAAGAATLAWFAAADSIPGAFVSVTPHVATLVVLAAWTPHLRPPAALGRALHRRGAVV